MKKINLSTALTSFQATKIKDETIPLIQRLHQEAIEAIKNQNLEELKNNYSSLIHTIPKKVKRTIFGVSVGFFQKTVYERMDVNKAWIDLAILDHLYKKIKIHIRFAIQLASPYGYSDEDRAKYGYEKSIFSKFHLPEVTISTIEEFSEITDKLLKSIKDVLTDSKNILEYKELFGEKVNTITIAGNTISFEFHSYFNGDEYSLKLDLIEKLCKTYPTHTITNINSSVTGKSNRISGMTFIMSDLLE